MRNLLLMCVAAVLLAAMVASASAADRSGSVSQSTLNAMGLGSMQVLSHDQGLAVRGMGTRVRVYGPTYDVTRPHFAARRNFSISAGGVSGGGSQASAW